MVMNRNVHPVGTRVLIKLKQNETISKGGIILETEVQSQKSKYATVEAYIVAMSSIAFRDFEPYEDKPVVGDLVKILKYCGENDTTIEDGEIYQVINDIDIIAVMKGEGLND